MEWLKGALAKVYEDYGIAGGVVVVGVVAALVYFFGDEVLALLGG
jgi:hypothetical protein